jgi:hypothetical protein
MCGRGGRRQALTVIRVAEAEPPHFRYLAMTGSGDVAAQMGVEFRVIRVVTT